MLCATSRTVAMTRTLTIGFSQQLPTGATLTSCSVTAEPGPASSTVKDTQSGATATLSGLPVINIAALTINAPNGNALQSPGQAISQQVTSGLSGANYVYRFKAAGSDGNTYEADLLQFVVPYVPTP
jgi:hypothetical protein